MGGVIARRFLVLILMGALTTSSRAADLVALSPQTWDRYIPQGKEVDGIYGDFALANDQIIAVVAHPRRGRNANMTVRDVGGCLIDLTRRDRQSDQLSAFYPGAQLRDLRFAGIEVEAPAIYEAAELDRVFVQARRVTLRLVAAPREKEPDVEVAYTLEDGWPYVLVDDHVLEPGRHAGRRRPGRRDPRRSTRSSRAPRRRPTCSGPTTSISARPMAWSPTGTRSWARTPGGCCSATATATARSPSGSRPGESYRLARRIIPGANLFDVRRVADQLAGKAGTCRPARREGHGGPSRRRRPTSSLRATASRRPGAAPTTTGACRSRAGDAAGHADGLGASGADRRTIALGARRARDRLSVELPEAAVGRRPGSPTSRGDRSLARCSSSAATGRRAPTSAPTAASTRSRTFTTATTAGSAASWSPGSYDVIVSYGPEYDAVFTRIDVARGKETPLEAKLVRSVKTDGWISADFHSHSSPSGDNTSSQLGRVLNLLCEHVEFAPCTEHNRLSTL